MNLSKIGLFTITALICNIFVDAGQVDYVNTLVGSASSHALSSGNTYPAVAVPWGMNFWTPMTGEMGNGWTYTYQSNQLRGFKQTHQPSPWINDYGQFAIMPTSGKPVFDQNARSSWFSHMAEDAHPHYYKVYLASHNITAEITPTSRAAVLRFTFGNGGMNNIVVDAFDCGSHVTVDAAKRRITGYTTKNSGGVPRNFKNYFVIDVDCDIDDAWIVENGYNDTLHAGASATGSHAGAVVSFNCNQGTVITARVASSFISEEQALLNLNELGNDDFDKIKKTPYL